ncbi:CDP-alcohol phosphatidyltransferase family protein [Patescibacteria group bacterium]|nr:CDP-alcohol phosphatidyltransferase family protein [Patescibacteria group bacterium]MBU4274459.1 CDP-alcohol phosphatidyltransferase family protein [Patescibacteria group bacterium]MBU4367942.1 CDP-alcohol phosphatidyltransferase family protein [Patescibacteria group bacterium]MBU4462280.1 CDP-alcohol phosphatidyltransferase family protein [Patescibacteria group bacterium]MCG2699552.1 CDP-alcohol phosphatidyltransferase family protein [Candidatus Parcubacteria bacterium]
MFFWFKSFLEKIDDLRDQLLFPFIKKYWPRFILPNHLTFLRILLAFVLVILLSTGFKNPIWLIIIFTFAAILDLFDGSVARALDKKTEFGAILDALADKILILPLAIYVLIQYYFWLLCLLILPEIISGLGVIYYLKKKRIVRATIFGKTKMVFECVAFAIILLNFPASPPQISIILLYVAAAFAFLNLILNFLVTKTSPS